MQHSFKGENFEFCFIVNQIIKIIEALYLYFIEIYRLKKKCGKNIVKII